MIFWIGIYSRILRISSPLLKTLLNSLKCEKNKEGEGPQKICLSLSKILNNFINRFVQDCSWFHKLDLENFDLKLFVIENWLHFTGIIENQYAPYGGAYTPLDIRDVKTRVTLYFEHSRPTCLYRNFSATLFVCFKTSTTPIVTSILGTDL